MKKILASLLFVICYLLFAIPVSAHPFDEIDGVKVYDQKQTLSVGNKTTLKIDLTVYAIEKIRIWESIDKNKDKDLSDDEKESWMNVGASSSYLIAPDGEKIDFIPEKLTFPDYYTFFDRPPVQITIEFETDREIKTGQNFNYYYNGKDKKLSEISFEIIGAENVRRINASSISFTAKKDSFGRSVLGIETSDRLNKFLSKFVKNESVSPAVILSALFVSFIIGALHALTPGHGKAIIAGYLIGSKGTIAHAVNLALIITVTHSASVFILGMLALVLTGYFVPSTVVFYLNKVSGILIVCFGIYLLITRIKELKHHHADPHHHEHIKDIAISWKNLIPLGVSGGIVPCIDALAILIVAASLGKLLLGLLILVSFSIGLAIALTGTGIAAVLAKNELSKRWAGLEKHKHYVGIFSAGIVTALGFALLI